MAVALMRIGVVRNPRSHANIGRDEETTTPDAVLLVEPATPEALEQDLEAFAQCGVGLLVIDGGDGTIRDVLSLLPRAFGNNPPLIALLPSGKTNVLAIDLGVPRDWTLEDAIAAARSDKAVIKLRAPLEVQWDDGRPPLRGFVFGLGAFVRATSLAKNVHKLGAFPALLKGRDSAWQERYGYRRGDAERLRITTDQPLVVDGDVYDGGCGLTVALAPTLRFLAS